MSIYNVGVSGLSAAQLGVLTTSHNIANASTPGYHRQQTFQTTSTPMFSGAGYVGQGTNVETVRRVYSQQLNGQMLSAQTGAAEMDSYLSQIDQISNLMADPDAGLSPALSDFFKSVQEMSANPASIPARQAMLSASQALVSRFVSIDNRMQEVRDGINAQVGSEVSAIHAYSEQIAEINKKIIYAQAAGINQPPNDLLDQRDQLVTGLNELIRTTVLEQDDGTYSIFIGNGQPLVVGTLAYGLEAVAAPDDPERIMVALKSPSGNTVNMPESLLTGGKLGGLLAFRSESLDGAQNALGRIAITLAENFNDQHKLGADLSGALGGDYFNTTLTGPVVRANGSNGVPTQNISVTLASTADLTTSDYRFSYDGTSYVLLRLADNTSQTFSTLPQTVDGITIGAGTWVPFVNDSFLIQPTRSGAASLTMTITDPRAIAAAAPVRTGRDLGNNGTGTISAGAISSVTSLPASTITMTYNATTGQFSGFPVGSDVTVTTAAGVATTTNIALASTPVSYVSGATISFNGMNFVISGVPANNDKFTLGPNANGVADNRNAVLMGGLQTQSTMEGGTANYQSAYSQIVSAVGTKARQVEITGKAQQTLYEQSKATTDELSGVNLDEEAANLLRYQQAYQAAAKMIDIAARLFDEVISLGR